MRFEAFVLFFIVTLTCRGQDWDTIPILPDHYKAKLADFKKQKQTNGKILFLGNSITEMGNFRKLLGDSSVINRGIGGDITFGIMQRLDEITRFKPSKLFLMIGVNDLAKHIPEDVILENMFLIISQIHRDSPGTNVFVQSILPVNKSFKNFPKGSDVMESVVVINTQLSKISKRFNYTYVDLYKDFTDKEGNLNAIYSTDGLHLNEAGYKQWIKILKDAKHF